MLKTKKKKKKQFELPTIGGCQKIKNREPCIGEIPKLKALLPSSQLHIIDP